MLIDKASICHYKCSKMTEISSKNSGGAHYECLFKKFFRRLQHFKYIFGTHSIVSINVLFKERANKVLERGWTAKNWNRVCGLLQCNFRQSDSKICKIRSLG